MYSYYRECHADKTLGVEAALAEALHRYVLCIREPGPRGGIVDRTRVWDRKFGAYVCRRDIDHNYIKIAPRLSRLWYGHPDMKMVLRAPHEPPPAGSALATATAAQPSQTRNAGGDR